MTETIDTALFSGDWLYNDVVGVYDLAFRGMPFTAWSGGETFLASRAVLERIARVQQELAATNPDLDWDQIRFDGDEATLVVVDGEEFPIQRTGDLYVVGFGWTWYCLDADDQTTEEVA